MMLERRQRAALDEITKGRWCMPSTHGRNARWRQAVVAVLVSAAFSGSVVWANETKSEDPTEKARATYDLLKKLQAAIAREDATKAERSGVKLPPRPPRTVSTPTFTHEDLDRLVDTFLESAKSPQAAMTTDVEFIRRVTLDLTGKLPSPEQVRAFVLSKEKTKRAKLIETLLASDDYARNWARYWRDVIRFRATTQNSNRVLYDSLEDWLTEQFVKNAPWDEITTKLITATGRDDQNGAVIFALAHETQAVELAGEVSRIFMGVQIQCAQCHDHPTDSWKRQQFHEFAAYFEGLRRKQAVKPGPGQRPVFEVTARGRGVAYMMPDKQDPQKKVFVAPRFFLDPKGEALAKGLTTNERLAVAAGFVTGQDNPWFAKAFVNRIWYVLMGAGFQDPVDDLGPGRSPRASEVLDALASEFQKGGYDIRWLLGVILNSRAYQREVRSTSTAAGQTSFAAVCPSRLRSDQILDSLSQALNIPMDARGTGPGRGAKGKKDDAPSKNQTEAAAKAKGPSRGGPRIAFDAVFGVDPSTPNDEILGTIPQALFLMNNPRVNNAIRARGDTVLAQVLARHSDNREALGALYIRTFSREPTQKELRTCLRYIEKVGNRTEAFEDIFWSLINSTEFVTRR
jgi:hypothetical protein